jgi:hypothetical protein
MRQIFARGRWPLAWLMLCALMSAMLFMPVPRPARAQQDSSRQLKHEENKQTPARRLALVIGNGAYQNAPVLKNPANDATDMAQALSDVGFAVEHGVNLTQKQMKLMIREFGKKLRDGGQGLFYFAGHGVQLRGRNYLIPVEAEIVSETDVEDQGVDASLVLGLMDEANNGLNVVILDACRNNPFARSFRSSANGLAQVDAPTGTLIAYSTAPGRVARDGTGRNGAYTAELLKQMKVPGRASALGILFIGRRFLSQPRGDCSERDERGERAHRESGGGGAGVLGDNQKQHGCRGLPGVFERVSVWATCDNCTKQPPSVRSGGQDEYCRSK